MKILEFKNLEINVTNKIIKIDEDLAINSGDVALLTGENGCGKSSFFKAIAGFPQEHVGFSKCSSIMFCGENVLALTDDGLEHLRRRIGYLPQDDQFISNSSVIESIMYPAQIAIKEFAKKLDKKKEFEIRQSAEKLFEKYLLPSLHDFTKSFYKNKVSRLSGGQKKMVSILSIFLKAKLTNSPLILLDEPLNNLDAKNKAMVSNLLTEIHQSAEFIDCAMLIITHCNIFPIINKVIEIKDGKMFQTNNANCYKCLGEYNSDKMYNI